MEPRREDDSGGVSRSQPQPSPFNSLPADVLAIIARRLLPSAEGDSPPRVVTTGPYDDRFFEFCLRKNGFERGISCGLSALFLPSNQLEPSPPPPPSYTLEHPQVQVQTEVNISPSPTTVEQLQNLSNTLIEVMQDIHNTEILQ